MPEGHTLHRLARDQQELVGCVVSVASPQGRFAEATAVDGRVLEAVDAYGKHLFHRFGADAVVHVHLGMRGKFLRSEAPRRAPLKQARLRLATEQVAWDLVAPSACELLDATGVAALVGRLGPDPLRDDADAERAWANLSAFPGTVGAALLDQAVVAGAGNVFRAEALFACGIHPTRPARSLTRPEFDRLWETLRTMMRQAVEDGRIITVDPARLGLPREAVPEAESRHVYKRERCGACATPVVSWDLAGRTAYACPTCQPAAAGAGWGGGPTSARSRGWGPGGKD